MEKYKDYIINIRNGVHNILEQYSAWSDAKICPQKVSKNYNFYAVPNEIESKQSDP